MNLYIFFELWLLQLISFVICHNYYHFETNQCQKPKQLNLFSTESKQTASFTEETNAIVLEKRINSSELSSFRTECSFKMKAKNLENFGGIYLNIVKMKLRKHMASGRCLDYIIVKVNGHERPPLCGESVDGEVIPYTDNSGEVKVSLTLESNHPLSSEDYVEIAFVATVFKTCKEPNPDQIQCILKKTCISSSYKEDGYKNCPIPLCNDEMGCDPENRLDLDRKASYDGTKIFTTITSVLFILFSVIACFWLISSYLEWTANNTSNDSNIRNNSSRNNSTAGGVELSSSSINTRRENIPGPIVPSDKDLPPTYESLFSNSN